MNNDEIIGVTIAVFILLFGIFSIFSISERDVKNNKHNVEFQND